MCEKLERHFRDLFPGVQVRHRDLAGNRQN
jgi:hypothetical protein